MIKEVVEYVKEKRKEILDNENIESIVLEYLENRYFNNVVSKEDLRKFQDEEQLAAWGYIDADNPSEAEIRSLLQIVLGKQEMKPGMHYSSNPILLTGIILAAKKLSDISLAKLREKALEKVKSFGIFDQFLLMSALEEKYDELYKGNIEDETIFSLLSLYALKIISPNSLNNDFKQIRDNIVKKIGLITTTGGFSFKDVFLFELFLENELKNSFKYEEHDAVSLIKQILVNFADAVSKITKDRRKDHPEFEISDEYDVQDLLYVILKPLFSDLVVEDPIVKHAGSSKRIDLVIPSLGITIEVKILKDKDAPRKFIEELNVDVSTYHKYPNIKYLLGFVYDPYNRITDHNEFYQLNGPKSNNGVSYDVEIIINPR